MRVLVGTADRALAGAVVTAFALDTVRAVALASCAEPDAFTEVGEFAPDVVVLLPAVTTTSSATAAAGTATAGSAADALAADPAADATAQVRGAWWLARAADAARAWVVVVSSADVFDGRDPRPRSEFDRPDPVTAAGRTADAVEQVVARSTRRHSVVRTGPLGLPGEAPGPEVPAGTSVVRLGAAVRALAAGRRAGTWHLCADAGDPGGWPSASADLGTRPSAAADLRAGRDPQWVIPPPLTAVLPWGETGAGEAVGS